MILNALLSAAVNVVLLAALPFGIYWLVQKRRHGRSLAECARRAGLQRGDGRSLSIAALFAAAVVAGLVIWPPELEPATSDGSAWRGFVGLELATAIPLALIYGVVKTGFAEELLFRGLIAGSLARRFSTATANALQALVFLLPHLLLLLVAPEVWPILFFVLALALVAGWLRIRSGSILGPWLIHAAANVAVGLGVALRTAP